MQALVKQWVPRAAISGGLTSLFEFLSFEFGVPLNFCCLQLTTESQKAYQKNHLYLSLWISLWYLLDGHFTQFCLM